MELKHLNTFLVLSRLKNFTKTAQYLDYAQSSVSAQIQRLEEDLHVRLFERIGKSVSLTPEGEQLVPYAQRLTEMSLNIENMYADTKNGGRLMIGASESIGIYILPGIIKQYKESHPDTDLHLDIADSSEFSALLANHSIDIAFTIDKHISDPSIVTVMEMEEPICIFAPPGHFLTQKERVEIRDFSGIPFIFTGHGCCYRGMFEREMTEHSVFPHIVLETSSIQVIKESAMSGLGLCVLPEFTVKEELESGRLVKIPYSPNCDISIQLIYHKDKWLSINMKDFIYMSEQFFAPFPGKKTV